LAGAIAYYTLLAIVPLFVMLLVGLSSTSIGCSSCSARHSSVPQSGSRTSHRRARRGVSECGRRRGIHRRPARRQLGPGLVFPEGTLVQSPGTLPFRLGAFKSTVETGRPVVPIAIRGTREILSADRWLPRPGPVTVTIGPPRAPDGQGWPSMVRLRDRTRAEIARHTGEGLIERAAIAS
jgi:1-acyl-sn-glycerol-3-phosphate acyltransferase